MTYENHGARYRDIECCSRSEQGDVAASLKCFRFAKIELAHLVRDTARVVMNVPGFSGQLSVIGGQSRLGINRTLWK